MPSFVVVTQASLVTGLSAAVAAVVGLVTWKLKPSPATRSIGPQVTTPAVSEHSPPALSSRIQARPASVGSVSVATTPFAVPVPLLVTVTVKPIGSPGLTAAASAVLTMLMWAGLQVIEADAESKPSLVEVALAVLSYVVHSAAEVVATTWTVALAPAVRVAGPKSSVWLPAPPLMEKPSAAPSIVQVTPEPEPAGSGIADGDPGQGPGAGVADGDVEADLVTGVDRAGIGGLGDVDVAQVAGDRGRRVVGTVVGLVVTLAVLSY